MKTLVLNLVLRPIRIHAWGGLGSQLFAYALSLDLTRRFPSRRNAIIFHTSGVSRRLPELLEIVKLDHYKILDDFAREEFDDDLPRKSKASRLRKLFKLFLLFTGTLATANDDFEFSKVKWWVFSVRGHYSHRNIDQSFFLHLETLLGERQTKLEIDLKNALVVHYRLGDLVDLASKSPDNPISVRREILRNYSSLKSTLCLVFSDSPHLAAQTLSIDKNLQPSFPELNAIDTLIVCVLCEYFIGSSSKLSYWAVALRCNVYQLPSSLPRQQKCLVHNLTRGSNLVSYFE